MNENKNELKRFLIKLTAISVAVIIILNVTFNLIFADKLKIFNIENIKDKIRIEMNKGLKKEKLINDEDKDLILKFYKKIQNELEDLETN